MNNPPKLISSFLRWFCHPDLIEDVEGDLTELFDERIKEKGVRKAKWLFFWDVIKLFRPSIIRPPGGTYRMNPYGLLRHNLIVSLRVLRKDRTFSVINILGLALAFATFLAIYHYVEYERSFEAFHENRERTFRITADFSIDHAERRYLASSPPRIAPFSAENIPEIQQFARIADYQTAGHGDLTISSGKKKFRESRVCFANPSFLEIFSFPLVAGTKKESLREIRTLILTESTAKKYFGNDNPMGQLLTVDGASEPYTVTGVLKDLPPNSHIQFDVLISYKTLNWWYEGEAENHWTNHEFYSYLLLKETANPLEVESKINETYLKERGEYNQSKNFDLHFSLQALCDIHFQTHMEQEIVTAKNLNPEIVQVISVVGWLILAIAWVNFINLSIARSMRRFGEISVRKTLGAIKWQIIGMFMMESFFVHLVASVIAGLFLLGSSSLIGEILGIEFNFAFLKSLMVDFKFVSCFLIASMVVGFYPAFLLSKGNVVLKKGLLHSGLGSKGWLSKGLVMFQFSVSVALIVGSLVIYSQLELMRKSDAGFDRFNKLVIRGPNQVDEDSDSVFQIKHRRFLNEISSQAYVNEATTAVKIPGEPAVDPGSVQISGFEQIEAQTMDVLAVGLKYFKTLGIAFQAGTNFERDTDFGSVVPVVINEQAAKLLGFQNVDSILNQKLVLNYKYEMKVIGVVDDYNHLSSRHAIEPLIFYCNTEYVHYYVIDCTGAPDQVLNKSEALLSEMFPRDPFDFFFLDEQYNRQYKEDEKLSTTILFFTAVTIFVACLGLIGLASHNTLRRVKEIGIRKTFGAGVLDILVLLNRETVWLLLIANVITWPLMYHFMTDYLNNFATRINLGPDVFLISGGVLTTIALLSISYITLRSAMVNPVDSLRDE